MPTQHDLSELHQLESLIERSQGIVRVEELMRCSTRKSIFPIYSVLMGSRDVNAPAVAFVGGIHGLERIGTQIILAFMETIIERAAWDEMVQALLQRIKIVFLPLMNPVGMNQHKRANGSGVDLMRNAPIDAKGATWLAGGQRFSPLLPWYRGNKHVPMEREAQALVDIVKKELFCSPFSLVVDCHSGFGMHDRIWFPYAKNKHLPMTHIAEVYALRSLLFRTYPNLNYLFEPQSQHYVTHGDLWDYLYDEALNHGTTMLPLTLELGSWLWVKKNPRQIRSPLGMFHPIQPHRIRRVLRHHQVLLEFMLRAACSHGRWQSLADIEECRQEALALWYPKRNPKNQEDRTFFDRSHNPF